MNPRKEGKEKGAVCLFKEIMAGSEYPGIQTIILFKYIAYIQSHLTALQPHLENKESQREKEWLKFFDTIWEMNIQIQKAKRPQTG